MRITRCGSTAVLGSESDADSVLGRSLSFWREELAGLPEQISLPFDRSRPGVLSYRGGSVELRLSGRLHGELLRLARSCGASLFMVLQAGLAALLTRLGAGDRHCAWEPDSRSHGQCAG
jgi:hypothetical protein